MTGLEKPERQIDEAHVAMVRTMPCCVHGDVCGGKVEPHHLHTRKAGGSDYSCVPLCAKLHTEVGVTGLEAFEQRYGVNLWLEAWRLAIWTLTGVRPHTKNRR